LLSHLGHFDPEPPAVMSTPITSICVECRGQGLVSGTISTGQTTWRYGSVTCPDCHGAGTVTIAA
jgi:DnaJ-class molecular chaperone